MATEAAPRTIPRYRLPLSGAAAAMVAAMSVASAAGTLQVGEQAGVGLAGAPPAAGIVGTAAGSVVVSELLARRGSRPGLQAGYAAALVGAALCATLGQDVPGTSARVAVLLAGTLLLGFGNAAAQLSRYVAAGLAAPAGAAPAGAAPAGAASAIATLVWITAVGAIGGPLLLGPSGSWAAAAGLPAGSGPFLIAAGCACAAVTLTAGLPGGRGAAFAGRAAAAAPLGRNALFARPGARSAFAALAAAQVIMVAVMTAAPIHLHAHGAGTTLIGTILSAHTLGMFALSPLTAVLVGRLGTRPVVLAGLALLAASAAGAAGTGGAAQTVPLFALGYAWNLCFVAGSTVLAAGADVADRLRVEGRIDALVWSVAALAALLSTVLLSLGGTAALAAAALLIAATAAAYRPDGRDRRDRRAGPDRPDRPADRSGRSAVNASPGL